MSLIDDLSKRNVKVLLIGNKSDLEDEREVSYSEALEFAESNNYYYIETSCIKNENVFEAFEKIIIETYKDIKLEEKKSENHSNTIKLFNSTNLTHKKEACWNIKYKN